MAKTALMMIEFQNDFLSEKGAMAGAGIWSRAKGHNVVANTKKILTAARKAGIPIIHSPISFREGYPELAGTFAGLLKGAEEANAFKKGTWGAQIVDDLTPKEGEIVLDKRRLCGFCDTELEGLLRNQGVENLMIAGFITNWCVEVTGRSAYDRGFHPVFLKDCTEALSDEEQKFAYEKIFPAIGETLTSDEAIAKFL
ncbi:MAG: cysteine hydrolase [Promethearchaeota archaeon]